MPSQLLQRFYGMISKGDKKDVNDNACVRQKNMVCANGEFSTRSGYVKQSSTEYSVRINMIYHFKRNVGSNKTLVASGGNLYAV